jgi:hypothetical protein
MFLRRSVNKGGALYFYNAHATVHNIEVRSPSPFHTLTSQGFENEARQQTTKHQKNLFQQNASITTPTRNFLSCNILISRAGDRLRESGRRGHRV